MSQNSDATGEIKVAGSSLSISDTLQVDLQFSTPTAPKELTAEDGKVYYYVDATHVREKTGVETSDKIGSCAYSIGWHTTYDEEIRKLANGDSITFEIATTGRVYLVTSASDITAVTGNKITVTVSVDSNGALSPTSGTVYFRVDGGAHTNGSAVTQDVANSTELGTITAGAPSGGGN